MRAKTRFIVVFIFITCRSDAEDTFKCSLEKSDRLDQNLAEVLVNPKKYLKGPLAQDQTVPEQHFVIAGAGIAGLTSAYMLLEAGHKVTILESSKRVGGRIRTFHGDDWYADLGAMRFPPYHFFVKRMFEFFKVPVQPFTNKNEGALGNYFYVNRKYYPARDLITLPGRPTATNQTALRELYALFRIPEDSIPMEGDTVVSPFDRIGGILNSELKRESSCAKDTSLGEFLRDKMLQRSLSTDIVQLWAILSAVQSFLPLAIDEFITDSDQKYWANATRGQTFVEVIGGAEVLVDKVMAKLNKQPKFQLKLNSRVTRVTRSEGRVTATFFDPEAKEKSSVTGNYMILTPTTKAQSLIEFSPPLDYRKMHAFKSIHYVNAVKIFLKFSVPWWNFTREQGNLAEPIVFGTVPDGKAGATGITDTKLIQIFYPSFPNHGKVIIASYSWDNIANFWHSMQEEEAIEFALRELEKIHGPIVKKYYEEGVLYMWDKNRHSHGGFIHRQPSQKYSLVKFLMEGEKELIFSGEYASKENNGWIEAAVTSATRNLVNMWPEAYEKEFGKSEKAFLTRQNFRRMHK